MNASAKLFTPTFRLYLAATVINFLGTGMHGIALPWLLLEMSHSPLSIGILLCIRAVPAIFLAPYAGEVADRLDRRLVCFWMNLLQGAAVLAVVALGWFDLLNEIVLYGMAFVLAVGNTFFFPAIRAYVQEATGKDHLLQANSLTESFTQAGMLIGTGVAGLLVAAYGALTALFIDGLTFFISAALLIGMRHLPRTGGAHAARPSFWRSQGETLRYVRHNRLLFGTFLFLIVPSVCLLVNNVLVAAYTMDVLHLEAWAYGFINLAYAIGAMLAGFWLAAFAKKQANNRLFIFFAIAALAVFETLFGHSSTLFQAIAFTFCIGCSVIVTRTWLMTKVMEQTDNAYAGRVQSLINQVSSIILLFAGLLVGGLAKGVGYSTVYLVLGALVLLCALAALTFYTSYQARQSDQREAL